MRYGLISNIAKIILVGVSILILGLLIFPIVIHQIEPVEPIVVRQSLNHSRGIEWALSHLKVKGSDDESWPDLVLIDDGIAFSELGFNEVEHNNLLLIALFHQYSEQPYNQEGLTQSTGVQWSGFMGRTFQDLGDINAVPVDWIETYEAQSKAKWSFNGEGIILKNSETLIVLRKNIDYDKGMTIEFDDQSIPYYGVFEILEPSSNSKADFKIDLTDSGMKRFETMNLSASFPAVIRLNFNLYQGYYLAGDFFDYHPGTFYQNAWWIPLMQRKMLYDQYQDEESYWKFAVPFLREVVTEPYENLSEKVDRFQFVTEGTHIYQVDSNNERTQFFSEGVNLGAALPGKTFTEFPKDKSLYLDWLTQMYDLGYNTVRIYTLLPPEFYQALYEFNASKENPIFLLQEIWPEEHPDANNYLAEVYNTIYKNEIEMNIRAIHGDIFIPERSFRAHGAYIYDVSPYILGYLVGRELEPEEVEATDTLNEGYRFNGEYLYSTEEATPTEAWLAASCDYALSVESERFYNAPLVGIVNWPTLDPLEHDSEWNLLGDKSLQYNDRISVDINNIGIIDEKVSGFFGAYHIYPNYPDFMNNDSTYNNYKDIIGQFRYGAYLDKFMSQHKKYPAIVAEYGISTSMVTAHYSPDGLNHGGISDQEQSAMIDRMTEAIIREGYSGAIVFEWIDEWAKKTWTTEKYMIPYHRQSLWHNVMDPEQNYGIVAVEAIDPEFDIVYEDGNSGARLKSVEMGQNAAYLMIKLNFNQPVDETLNFKIGLNLYDETPEYLDEFEIQFSSEPRILVNPGYNWVMGRYRSFTSLRSSYEEMIQLVNKSNVSKDGTFIDEKNVNLSLLKIGPFDVSQNSVMVSDHEIYFRVPYGLLGISDPSSQQILWDKMSFVPTEIDQINTVKSEIVKLNISLEDEPKIRCEFPLSSWEEPEYKMRLKSED